MKESESVNHSVCPWDYRSKNSGVGSCALLQSFFPIQDSNPVVLHYRQIVYHLNHQESPV